MQRSLQLASLWIVSLGAVANLAASPILILNPMPGVSGSPGALVGWGFTITNDSGYIEINSAQFCSGTVNFPLVCDPATSGVFQDFISKYNDIIVGPPGGTDPSSVTQGFDPLAHLGAGSFQIDGNAPAGTEPGEIVLTYTLTDLDPNDSSAMVLGQDLVLSASASVTTAGSAMTPEPSPGSVLAFVLAGAMVARKVRVPRKRSLRT